MGSTNLSAEKITKDSAQLSWSAAKADTSAVSYQIMLNGQTIAKTNDTHYMLTKLHAATAYNAAVSATATNYNPNLLKTPQKFKIVYNTPEAMR